MKAYKLPKLSVEEYIRHEQESGGRYEYHDGEIFALAGGTFNHGVLCGNIFSELGKQLDNNSANCRPFTSEIKLCVESKNTYCYPDSMVICGPIQKSEQDKNAVTNPILVVEVLSKSTADYDRGDKFYLYRQIPSLQEYVLIEQDKPVVEVYYKRADSDLWSINRFEGLDAVIQLQSITVKIKMTKLYTGLDEETY